MIPTVVWGTGNVGRAAIRAVDAHPVLSLVAVLASTPAKVGRDAGELGGLDRRLGVAATDDVAAVLAGSPRAVVYAASGDVRMDGALDDTARALRTGAVVVTPSPYGMYDCRSAPPEIRDVLRDAAGGGGGSLFVSGVDPGWANDVLPALVTGLGTDIDAVRCQEIFDYSTYDQETAVRDLIGMGHPLEYQPLMLAAGIPTMIWGGQLRLIARALGVELDDIDETLERRPLESDVETGTLRRTRRPAASRGGQTRKEVIMRIDIPDGAEPIPYVWGEMVPGIGPAASAYSLAVYAHTTLGLREFEAARLRIAQINGCLICLDWRTERDGQKVEEEFLDAVLEWRTTGLFDERTRLAAEYAERYAEDHHGLDDAFWDRMAAHYSQREIVELTMSIGAWLAFGRLNHVLGLDAVCVLKPS